MTDKPTYEKLYLKVKELEEIAASSMRAQEELLLQSEITNNMAEGVYLIRLDDESFATIYSWSREAMQDCRIDEKNLVFPVKESGIWANAIREKRSFALNDYHKKCLNKNGLPAGHVDLTRVLSVPVLLGDRLVAIGVVANVNRALCELLNMQSEDLIGHRYHEFVDEETEALIFEDLAKITPENHIS